MKYKLTFLSVFVLTPSYTTFTNGNRVILNVLIFEVFLFIAFIILILFSFYMFYRKKKSEERVKRMISLLRVVNRILRHDVRNQLTRIEYAVELLPNGESDENCLEIKKSAKRGNELINQMRELEILVEAGGSLKPISVRKIVEESAGAYKIPISIDGDAIVYADQALFSVIDNLIRNAIEHGKAKIIKVITTVEKKYTKVSVIDDGLGVPEEIKDRMFEESETNDPLWHTGLGLYIARQSMDRYGGDVTFESNKPNGSIFTLRFPKHRIKI
ncbi:MAG: PAS/PAC sensor signal transduction histidine kinase [uncultured bacterium]|nr:MAG: PAS/PAC sensor signal transduction histidine kinase [uncultured bacterium]HBD04993.1 hypothetical protein [Candidatus Uhrbacteria bacterium]